MSLPSFSPEIILFTRCDVVRPLLSINTSLRLIYFECEIVAIVRHAYTMPPHLIKQHKSADNVYRRQLYHVNQTLFRFG